MREPKRGQNRAMLREIDALSGQSVGKLKIRYLEVLGHESRSNHKQYLLRRIAWRLQANTEGDLSERARARALALAEEAELRIRAPQSFLRRLSEPAGKRQPDPRLPPPGTVVTRQFRGASISVEILEQGFRYQERVFQSLSAVARHVTGVQWNGFKFFALPSNTERL
jgi:hypothetical protein